MEREERKEERRGRGTRREKLALERGRKRGGRRKGAAQTITDGHRTLFFILHYPCSAPLRSIMPAPRINDELGDELPPPLLCNAHLREHTDKHRSSVADLRGIYPALFFNPPDTWNECAFAHEPRHVHLDANRGISLKKKKEKGKVKLSQDQSSQKLTNEKSWKEIRRCLLFFFFFLQTDS